MGGSRPERLASTPPSTLEARNGNLEAFSGWDKDAHVGGAVLEAAHQLFALHDQDGLVGWVGHHEVRHRAAGYLVHDETG